MPKKTEIRTIYASYNEGEFPVESIDLNIEIDTFPTATAVVHFVEKSKAPQIIEPASSDVIARMGALQKIRLAGVEDPDFKLRVSTDADETDFVGYLSAPVMETTTASSANQLSAVGGASVLDTIDLSVYTARYSDSRVEANGSSGPQLKGLEDAASGDIIKLITHVTTILVANFDASLAKAPTQLEKDLLINQHAINQNALPLWFNILEESEVNYASMSAAIAKDSKIGRRMSQLVKDVLTTPSPGFWNAVRSLMSHFQMIYVPSLGSAGVFERADVKVAPPESTIRVSVDQINVVDGSKRLLPMGGVIMRAMTNPSSREESEDRTPKIVAFYPQPMLGGFIQKETPPTWLLDNNGYSVLGSEIDQNQSQQANGPRLSLKEYQKTKKKAEEHLVEVGDTTGGVMSELCEVIFKEMQLTHSTGVISEPLNLLRDKDVGKRLTVVVEGDDPGKFVAFVKKVSHHLQLERGKHLSSSTRVELSHIEY